MTARPLPPDIEDMISGRASGRVNGHNRPPPIDDVPPVTGPEDYGVVSSARGISQPKKEAKKEAKKPPRADWRNAVITADALQKQTFPPLEFVVSGLVPAEGLTLVCSKPKVGKSWLVLDLAIAATMDRFVLGDKKAKQGSVLYLALEDSQRRLQSRMTKIAGTFVDQWPKTLTMATEWARMDQGGLDDINAWVQDERAASRAISFIAIDTLKTVRPPLKSGQTPYDSDYDAVRVLQQLALQLGVAIIVVHHTRKAESDDFLDRVSGTFGITGAADAILIIDRDAHGMVFDIRGRDVESNTFATEFGKSNCRWTILGDATDVHQSKERKIIRTIFRSANGPIGPTEVLETGKRMTLWDTAPTIDAVKKLLGRMVDDGLLAKAARGKYELVEHPPGPSPFVPFDDDIEL